MRAASAEPMVETRREGEWEDQDSLARQILEEANMKDLDEEKPGKRHHHHRHRRRHLHGAKEEANVNLIKVLAGGLP